MVVTARTSAVFWPVYEGYFFPSARFQRLTNFGSLHAMTIMLNRQRRSRVLQSMLRSG
jgi:hypothetical protein